MEEENKYDKEFVQQLIAGVITQLNNYHLSKWMGIWRTMIKDEIALAVKYMPKCGCKRKKVRN